MYKFIGGDQKEYGPVTAEQIREWVAEGRANGQTLILAEGTTEWRPLSAFPELAAALVSPPPLPQAAPVEWTPESCLARDYRLNIGEYFSRSWQLLHRHLGLFVRAVLLVLMVDIALQVVSYPFMKPTMDAFEKSSERFQKLAEKGNVEEAWEALLKPELTRRQMLSFGLFTILKVIVDMLLQAGMCLFVLKLIRGREAGVKDLLAGFGAPVFQLVLAALLTGALPMMLVCCLVIPGVYLSLVWTFAVPLIMDRRMNVFAAMDLSRKRVHRHFLEVFSLWLVAGVIKFAGELFGGFVVLGGQGNVALQVLGFGISFLALLLSLPMMHGLRLYAYEDMFHK